MRRKPRPANPDPRPAWMIEQGARCGCRGTDDMCPCQNENPWPRKAVDWKARAQAAESRLALAEKVVEAGRPFAECVERDIGPDETDADLFRNCTHNRAPNITVGHFRALTSALTAYEENTSSNDLTTGEDDA